MITNQRERKRKTERKRGRVSVIASSKSGGRRLLEAPQVQVHLFESQQSYGFRGFLCGYARVRRRPTYK